MADEEDALVYLDSIMVKSGLCNIGVHPISMNHTFLELSVPKKGVTDISILSQYPNLMFLDISGNSVNSLTVLSDLAFLIGINASDNKLKECLDFCPTLCNHEHATSDGHTHVGSMLTQANLSNNQIESLKNGLGRHKFLECLLLKNNSISVIEGVSDLKFLKILDLSQNKISTIHGLDNLNIRELDLSGNQLKDLAGLECLEKLTSLNVSNNKITSLYSLSKCVNLTYLNVSKNNLKHTRQAEFLGTVTYLKILLLHDNPCHAKEFYRLRIIYRLPRLVRLDFAAVTADEVIRAKNLYQSEEGDIKLREKVFYNYQTHAGGFMNSSLEQLPYDDEDDLTIAELSESNIDVIPSSAAMAVEEKEKEKVTGIGPGSGQGQGAGSGQGSGGGLEGSNENDEMLSVGFRESVDEDPTMGGGMGGGMLDEGGSLASE